MYYLKFPCVEYLIDYWEENSSNQNNLFYDSHDNNYKTFVQFICSYGSTQDIMDILDICEENPLYLKCEKSNGNCVREPIHLICKYSNLQSINRIIDIYVKNNLNLECKTAKYWTPLHFCVVTNHMIK